jgi:hypothetical protein
LNDDLGDKLVGPIQRLASHLCTGSRPSRTGQFTTAGTSFRSAAQVAMRPPIECLASVSW